jgi:GT2 family glycosyltransferase
MDNNEREQALAHVAAWRSERDRQQAEFALGVAQERIGRTLVMLRAMRSALVVIQDSKFWKLRNSWFSLKHRLKLSSTGPIAYAVPDLDELDEQVQPLAYDRWMQAHRFRAADELRLRDMIAVLPLLPKFSIIMPVYETPAKYLREAIESVYGQVYTNWELCIADDASKAPHVREILEQYARHEPRVKLVFRGENGHISATSNSALSVATGEFVVLLDHDDMLSPDALFENAMVINRRHDIDVIYSDEDKFDDDGHRHSAYFKPDWAPDTLLSRNYVSHLGVYRRTLVEEVGGFRNGFEGSQDYDLLLRVTEKTDRVAHIPRILYHWRSHPESAASARDQKGYALEAGLRALSEALERRGEPGRVAHDEVRFGLYSVRYDIRHAGKVSIIIPTRDHGEDVDRCLTSLFERSTYSNFEIILLDNGSRDKESLQKFREWQEREPQRLRIVEHDVPFNFSNINNFAAAQATGDYLLFLNNDTEIVTSDWIEAMVEQAQRQQIGAVGVKLLYEDDTIQHAGVIVGLGGVAGHSHKYFGADAPGYFYTLQTVNNFSAVTGACMMMRRGVFEEVGGFDEELAIAFNDVDLCLRIRAHGYRNIYLPHVVLYHHESRSRGHENTPEKEARFLREQKVMRDRWKTAVEPDPYYNINLSRDTENYEIGI